MTGSNSNSKNCVRSMRREAHGVPRLPRQDRLRVQALLLNIARRFARVKNDWTRGSNFANGPHSTTTPLTGSGWLATNISGDEEATEAAASVMAPNTDSGLFGNPEERNMWMLTNCGTLHDDDDEGPPCGEERSPRARSSNGFWPLWGLADREKPATT